jgi:O-antigen/teichoic acid export membrane protein
MKQLYIRITKQIGFSYATTVLLFLINPVLIMLLTRSLSVEDYGIYAILAVTVNVAGVLLDLGLSQYILSRLAGIPARQRLPAFATLSTFLMLFLIVVITAVLFTPLESILLSALRLTEHAAALRIGLFVIMCNTLVRVYSAYLMAQKRVVLVNALFFVSQSLWVFLVIGWYGVLRELTILQVITLWFAGSAITLMLSGWLMRQDFAHFTRAATWRPKLITEGLLFSLPLLAYTVGSWTIEIGDRYMLNAMLGSASVGLYTLVYSLLGVIVSLATVVALTFFPYLASAWNRGKDYGVYLNAAVKYSLLILFPAMAGALVLREPIVTLISGAAYQDAAAIIPALILYPLFGMLNYILYQVTLLRKRTVLIGATYCAGAALNIGLNFALIPRFHMVGAAIATVASYALVFAVLAWDARKSLHIDPGFLRLGRILLASAIMGVAVWLVQPQVAFTKIAAIVGGAALYFLLVFLLGVFSWQELELVRNVVPKQFRALVPMRLARTR